MKLSSSFRVLALLVLIMGASLPAYAQDERKAEVSFGYQLLSLREDGANETLGKGWYADVAGNVGPIFAVVFQVGGNYKTVEESATIAGVTSTFKADLKLHNFLGGVRVGPRHTAFSPYAEFLVGGVNGSVDAEGSVVGGGTTIIGGSSSDSSTEFAMQFGGGVTIWLSKAVGVRGSIGYLRINGDGDDANVVRATGGISFGF
jgi:hypothetical protein